MIACVSSTDQDAVNSVIYIVFTGLDDMENCAFTNFGNPLQINASLDFEAMNTKNIGSFSAGQSKAGHNNAIHTRVNDINYANGASGVNVIIARQAIGRLDGLVRCTTFNLDRGALNANHFSKVAAVLIISCFIGGTAAQLSRFAF